MAQRWVLYGDGLLVPTSGFGETLLDHLLIAAPQAVWQASLQGTDEMTLATALHEASWRVIGKAPHGVVFAFGAHEIEKGEQANALMPILKEILHLTAAKTQAQMHLFGLPLAFFPEGSQRVEAEKFNQGLREMALGSVTYADANLEIDAFLEKHRTSLGEKRALHVQATRPTHLGRLLLAHSMANHWPWPLF